jgi:glycine cleavage system regulatory protein
MVRFDATAEFRARRAHLGPWSAVLVGALVLGGLVLGSPGSAVTPAGAETAPPARWDPRVAKYVAFVEKHRKLGFDHPVKVEFLADAAFIKAYQRDDPEITKQDRVEAERIAGELRAVGLIEGPVDLIESERDLGATDTVGFYDQKRKALYVRGTDLADVDVRVTLVHELTHALQDQHFDLTELDDAVETEGEDFALTALIEGDATSVEDDYLFSLPQAEQDAYFAGDPADTVDDATSPGIPPVLDLFTSGPYVFGARYIGLLRQAGGERRVDDAFAAPPVTEEEIIDPVAARAAQRGRRVATPKLTTEERRSGKPNEFGAWSLYLVLASRLDPELALHAAEGWGGDRYVGFTERGSGGQECLRISIVGDTSADTAELADAFSQWAALLPADAATSTRVGSRVDVSACDTGSTTAADDATLEAAVTLLVDRNDIALELLRAEAPPRRARCAADRLAVDPTLVALLDEAEFTPEQEDQFTDLVSHALTACRTT